MEVIKQIVEDKTLSPAEKVLFAILYCRKQGNECGLSVQELVQNVEILRSRLESRSHKRVPFFFPLTSIYCFLPFTTNDSEA